MTEEEPEEPGGPGGPCIPCGPCFPSGPAGPLGPSGPLKYTSLLTGEATFTIGGFTGGFSMTGRAVVRGTT